MSHLKVRLLTSRASAKGVNHAGEVISMYVTDAQRAIERGQAELIREEPVETAVLGMVERTVKRRKRKRA